MRNGEKSAFPAFCKLLCLCESLPRIRLTEVPVSRIIEVNFYKSGCSFVSAKLPPAGGDLIRLPPAAAATFPKVIKIKITLD